MRHHWALRRFDRGRNAPRGRAALRALLAVERIYAAVEAAAKLPYPFVLTARSENFIRGRPDLDDTLWRLQAFEKAGADVLYAPGLPDERALRLACKTLTSALGPSMTMSLSLTPK